MINERMEHWWVITGSGKQKYSEKNMPTVHTTSLTWTALRTEPGEKPATNRLSCGTTAKERKNLASNYPSIIISSKP
jgi:hypothetical protein